MLTEEGVPKPELAARAAGLKQLGEAQQRQQQGRIACHNRPAELLRSHMGRQRPAGIVHRNVGRQPCDC